MTHPTKQAGFTLFELLVVLAAMGVVSTIGVGAFFNVTDAWRQSAFRMELGDKAESVLNSVKADIDRVAATNRTGQAIQGTDGLTEKDRYERVRLGDDRIVLPLVQKGSDGTTERLAVMYHVQRNDAPRVLTRTIGPLNGTEPAGARQEIGSDVSVLSLEIEYLDKGTWQDGWSENHHPDAVRVSVTVGGQQSRPYEQITRSRIYPIHVK